MVCVFILKVCDDQVEGSVYAIFCWIWLAGLPHNKQAAAGEWWVVFSVQ